MQICIIINIVNHCESIKLNNKIKRCKKCFDHLELEFGSNCYVQTFINSNFKSNIDFFTLSNDLNVAQIKLNDIDKKLNKINYEINFLQKAIKSNYDTIKDQT